MGMRGSKYRKVDLHIHTPASRCYEDRDATAEDIVDFALAADLQAIAITDHNTTDFIDEVREAAKETLLHVFPGVEITASGAHILAIFDLKTKTAHIDDLLSKAGIAPDMRGKQDALGHDAVEVIRLIEKQGGVAIAAHANSSNGILRHPQGRYKQRACKLSELYALELRARRDVEKFTQGEVPGYPAKACVQGSDAHDLDSIGERYTHLKMDRIALRGVRQALIDHTAKVRFEWNDLEASAPRITRLFTTQGFFEGEERFDFHPNFNCLVGGKGAGKSTIIELMRYAWGSLPPKDFSDIRDDSLGKAEKLVGIGGTIVVLCQDEDGEEFHIQREVTPGHSDDPVCWNSADEECPIPFFPLFFSQNELVRIASSTTAQLALLDQHLSISEENRKEKDLLQDLGANASSLIACREKRAGLEAAVDDPKTGKAATERQVKRLQAAIKDPALQDFPLWESEQEYIKDHRTGLEQVIEDVGVYLDDFDFEEYFETELKANSPNRLSLAAFDSCAEDVRKIAESAKRLFGQSVRKLQDKLKSVESSWNTRFEAAKAAHKAAAKKMGNGSVSTIEAKLRTATKSLTDLEKKERQIAKEKTRYTRLQSTRERKRVALRAVRRKRYNKREQLINRWKARLGDRVSIELVHLGERREYVDLLKSILEGSHIQTYTRDAIMTNFLPDEFAAIVRESNLDALTEAGLNAGPARKAIQFLSNREKELFELEAVTLEDQPDISLEVEPGVYKPLNELSVGGKGTVLILLAMVEGSDPLIIDQPEDSLDPVFIYEEIVQKVREGKDQRQFLFATHNANLLIAGEADLSFILKASADKGSIENRGGIDRHTTKDLLLLHLEGGPDAFSTRNKKYS